MVSDRATFADLGDVYVDEEMAGGLGKFLLDCVLSHPELQGLRKWTLATADAHGLFTRMDSDLPRTLRCSCSSSDRRRICGHPSKIDNSCRQVLILPPATGPARNATVRASPHTCFH